MKKQVFLTYRSEGLPAWKRAFPSASIQGYSGNALNCDRKGDAVIWLHLRNGVENPGELVSEIKRASPLCPVIVLSNVPSDDEGMAVLEAGASGYTNALAIPELLEQIDTVVENGGLWVGPELMQRLLLAVGTKANRAPQPTNKLQQLSPREREVAIGVAAGATNKEIARQLDITERTVKAHLSHIFELLKVRDRLQLSIIINGLPNRQPEATKP